MTEKIRFWLVPQTDAPDDPFFGPQLAYDVQVLQPDATVGDYLAGVCAFQAEHLADCKGCDGCCHERAPLTICDWQLAHAEQAEPSPEELAQWLKEWAALSFCGPAIDLTLKRTPEGACQFLDNAAKCCRIHQQRSFTCRSHCCLPKTRRAELLRGAIINAGEDELVRQLLQLPKDKQPWAEQLANCRLEDYAPNAFSALPLKNWAEAPLRELAGQSLWAAIYQPPQPQAD